MGEGRAEEREDAVASDVAEGRKLERVVAAVELQAARLGTVAAEGVEHLPAEFREHCGVVFAVDEEGFRGCAHAAFDVRHRTDRRPVFAKFVDGNVLAQAFPDVVRGHTLTDDVGVVGGEVEEAAGFDGGIVHQRYVSDRGTEASAKNTQPCVPLLLEPSQAAASVVDGLAVGLNREADVGATDLVGAFVPFGHAAVMVGHAHFQGSEADALQPFAQAALAVPLGVPVG